MADDYRDFQRIDSDGYADDRPLDTGLLRRMRKQVQSVGGFPDPCSLNERKNPGGALPEMYSATPRTIGYHVRRIPAGTEGIRVTAPLAGGPEASGVTAGKARIIVRLRGDVYRSSWQDVDTTASGVVKPYTFDVDGLSVRRGGLCEVALVTQSGIESTADGRNFSRTATGAFLGRQSSPSDPYGEDVGLDTGGGLHDFVLYFGDFVINPHDPKADQVTAGAYALTPAPTSGGLGGDVVKLFWISAPYGWEVRPQFSGDAPVSYWAIRAGVVPSSTRGPGKIQQEAAEVLARPVCSSSGTLYRDKPGSAWSRYPRWKEHTDGDRLTETHPFRLHNSPVRLRASIAMIGIKTDETVDVSEFGELLDYTDDETCTVRLRVNHPVNGDASLGTKDVTVTCFPFDRSGVSPFLNEQRIADDVTAGFDGWTYRDGQLWVGDADRQRGDLRLISLQTITFDLTTDDVDLLSMVTDETYTATVEFEDFPADRKIVVLNTTLQQTITG